MNQLVDSLKSCTINKHKIVYAQNGIFDGPDIARHDTELVRIVEQRNMCCDCDLLITTIDSNIYKIYKRSIYDEVVLEPHHYGYIYTEHNKIAISKYSMFQISPNTAKYMADRGDLEAAHLLDMYYRVNNCKNWFGYINEKNRHNPLLIEAIETLGFFSSGYYCNITLQTIEKNYYKIVGTLDEIETVIEPFMEDFVYI